MQTPHMDWWRAVIRRNRALQRERGESDEMLARWIAADLRAWAQCQPEVEVTVYDAEGHIVTQEKAKARVATQEQIDGMVRLIEGGMKASEAANLVMADVGLKQLEGRALLIVTDWLGMFNPQPQIDFQQSAFLQQRIVAEFKDLKASIDTALNNRLVDMKPGYDDSVTGFNEAWDVVNKTYVDR